MSGIFGIWQRDGSPVDPDGVRAALMIFDRGETRDRGYLLCSTKTGKTVICTDGGNKGLDNYRGKDFDLILGSSQPEISDLGRRGRQPASDKNARIFCLYEGELYNVNEVREYAGSRAEEEAALIASCFARGGIDSLSYLNGLFSLAFWNGENRELTLVRDPVGGGPYFTMTGITNLYFPPVLRGSWRADGSRRKRTSGLSGILSPKTIRQ